MPQACQRFWKCHKKPHVLLTLDKVHNPLRMPRETTSDRPKVLRTPQFFAPLTSKCSSRHNGVHFLDIKTFKSAPKLRCFVHFWLGNVLRATTACTFSTSQLLNIFWTRHFLHLWLRNVLRATTACNFSSLIWPAGSAPAALASLLFDPPEPQIIGKTMFRDFLTFSRTWMFFDLLSSSLLFSSLLLSSLLWLFPSLLFICPYCRKFDF